MGKGKNKPKTQPKPNEQPKKDHAHIPINELPENVKNLPSDNAPGSQPANADTDGSVQQGRAISVERWQEAQAAERAAHDADTNNNAAHYAATYKNYFAYVGLGTELPGLAVIEIGPADNPALAICKNWHHAAVIEPMASHKLVDWARQNGVQVWAEPLENMTVLQVDSYHENIKGVKEVWLFNVMQHIIDPDAFVDICKALGDRIRFFEPINTPVEPHHPHTYTLEDFKNWFGSENVKLYKGGDVAGFHTADCAYGVWIKG